VPPKPKKAYIPRKKLRKLRRLPRESTDTLSPRGYANGLRLALFAFLSLFLPASGFANVGNHSLFIKTDGSLWGMGLNSNGQLGNGTNSKVTTPQKMVDANSTNPIVEVSTGATHTLFIRKDGSLWGMGGNNRGQLGDGNLTDRNTPVRIVSSGVASCLRILPQPLHQGGWLPLGNGGQLLRPARHRRRRGKLRRL
jgi:hypothetical protein